MATWPPSTWPWRPKGGDPVFVWLLGSMVGLIMVHEGAHLLVARLYGGRFVGVVWDWRHARVGVALDVQALTPSQFRQTLIAAPVAEALWVGVVCHTIPALGFWWRWLLPVHWSLNAWPFGTTDGARWWQSWRQQSRDLREVAVPDL